MTKIITRFAPSPTGYLHVGNARTAIINWLFAKKNNGKFILRFDDTDKLRSSKAYSDAILQDLDWLGLTYDETVTQSSRLARYALVKQTLLKCGRLYPCFESESELQLKRKIQLKSGKPPIYDRAALTLAASEVHKYLKQGIKPHYRFLLGEQKISWLDMIKGKISYKSSHLSDPIVIKEDGSMTYLLCSTIDDIDYQVSHVIRGEDHVTNTATQLQIFAALGASPPQFAHLNLITAKDDKISKRIGGFEIRTLRTTLGFEALAVINFFTFIGSSKAIMPFTDVASLIDAFDITSYAKSPTIYQPQELARLNHKIMMALNFAKVKDRIRQMGLTGVDEQFWLAVRPNLQKLDDLKAWWLICHAPPEAQDLDKQFLKLAAQLLPQGVITPDTWDEWTTAIAKATGKCGKELFMPLRLALTGRVDGPELRGILPLIGREESLRRLLA